MMISPRNPKYRDAVDNLKDYVETLRLIREPTDSEELRKVLNGLISEALRLRVNIEYGMDVKVYTETRSLKDYE